MRVLLRGGHPGDQDGAVAIVVAICLVVLLGFAAFVVDFGLAYTNRQRLQIAADAAVLGAASTFVDEPGDCPTLSANTGEASTAALELMQENHSDATVVGNLDVSCSPSGRLQVSWENESTTDVGLGGVFGVDDITASARATAEVGVPRSIGPALPGGPSSVAGRVMPYPICSNDLGLPAVPDLASDQVTRIQWDGDADETQDCPTEESSTAGDFWGVRCPEESATGPYVLASRTATGCLDTVSVVADQTAVDPAGLNAKLTAACQTPPAIAEDCLKGISALLNGSTAGLPDNWAGVLGERVFFPVFCGDASCTPAAFVDASPPNRNDVFYPVHHLVGALVCGYDWGDTGGSFVRGYDTGNPDCDNVDAADVPAAADGQDDYLLIRPVIIPVAGDVAPRDCALGSACDIGPRSVYLVE